MIPDSKVFGESLLEPLMAKGKENDEVEHLVAEDWNSDHI